MAFSHGGNDAQKTMGVITMALASYYGWTGSQWSVPLWVILAAATSMGLGTCIGGWRIIRTMGLKVVELRPINGFAAVSAAVAVIEVASRLGIPVSATHVISSAIMGGGSHQTSVRRSLGDRRTHHRGIGADHSGLYCARLGHLSAAASSNWHTIDGLTSP